MNYFLLLTKYELILCPTNVEQSTQNFYLSKSIAWNFT